MREPGDQRYAVIPPFPARWLLTQMATGRTVTKASVLAKAKELAASDSSLGRLHGGQLVGAYRQLEAAALDGEPDDPSVLRAVQWRRHGAAAPQEPPDGGDVA